MIERRPTGKYYQTYLNPDRAIDEGARQVTGIEDEFLLDKPRFADVVEEFLAFVDGAELIIHNATFDVGFINGELARLGESFGRLEDRCSVLDTLMMARERYPGQRNSLDALCKRLGVDNSARDLHGGLIDAQLLADVYIAMTSGQVVLDLGFEGGHEQAVSATLTPMVLEHRPRVLRANADEVATHEKRLDGLDKSAGGVSVWRREEAATVN